MNKLYGTRSLDFLFISEFGLEYSCQALCWINRTGISFILSSLGAYGGAPKVDYRGAVASVRDSYTDHPSSIRVRLVVASW